MQKSRISAAIAVAALGATTGLLTAGPAEAAGSVHLTKIYYDSPGKDTRSNASLNAEYVQIKNTTSKAVSLRGWTLVDASRHSYVFPSFTLKPGKTVTVHTGRGSNTAAHLYQQRRAYVWNNDRDKATLKRASGAVQDTCSYNDSRRSWTAC
ncbi:lamin tail domain-containing protein [Peterkaempfera bronchialis]|uniref:Lamin tail domain-containing protein n=1 Tax=Peterkaempfera bronchialis TaxID=2126346 RepID=A0A345SV86_9ACTN|nr:lamin tail domain-containing protein [Peterkaempfera bronchialis]AXI77641.1 lamin tail domain-containing protein [Peterkaempfera bronchialis]